MRDVLRADVRSSLVGCIWRAARKGTGMTVARRTASRSAESQSDLLEELARKVEGFVDAAPKTCAEQWLTRSF